MVVAVVGSRGQSMERTTADVKVLQFDWKPLHQYPVV